MFVWQSANTTSLSEDDYCYGMTPKATDMSHVTSSQPKSSVLPRLATIFHIAMQNKDYIGKRLSTSRLVKRKLYMLICFHLLSRI